MIRTSLAAVATGTNVCVGRHFTLLELFSRLSLLFRALECTSAPSDPVCQHGVNRNEAICAQGCGGMVLL